LSNRSNDNTQSVQNISNRSISRDLTISLIITVVLVSTLAFSISYINASQNVSAQLEDEADEFIASLVSILIIPLWNFDEETTKGIVASYVNSEFVAKLKIVNSMGAVYFEIDKEIDAPLINRSQEIFHKDKLVGHLDISLTSGYYKVIIHQYIWSGAFITLIILISLMIMIRFLLRRFLQTPLNYFSDVVSSYGLGKYDFSGEYTPVIEFQPFVAVLSAMGAKITAPMSELKQARNELEIRVKERTAELAKTNKELETEIVEHKRAKAVQIELQAQLQRAEKMEAIGTLAGGVAHDLNNILSGVVSYPELLLLDIPEDSHLRKPLQTIQKSGEKAATIVDDLLTLARRGVPVAEVVNLNMIIAEYLQNPEHSRLKLFHPTVNIETDFESDLLNISGSPVHLSKTIMNLVSNAAEAMPDGGKIIISTTNRYIDKPIRGYDAVNEGDYVILCVADTGAGILPEDMERIFEPFYTKKVMGRSGTGLGMAVVWGTVKDHNGYIDVHSRTGRGATFTLYFPVTRDKIALDKLSQSMRNYMGDSESILVVDDVEEQKKIASGILTKLGYTVTSVSSGEEAIDYLQAHTVDLIVLDMIMDPGMDGCDTYKQILKLHPGQKAVIASGFSETDRVKEAQQFGAGAYIKKPYTLEKIGIGVKNELAKTVCLL